MSEKSREISQQTANDFECYLKALPIRQLSDIEAIKMELSAGNIVIAKITTLAKKSLDDTERAVEELCAFIDKIRGGIARLGEERLVLVPSPIKIWKEKENLE